MAAPSGRVSDDLPFGAENSTLNRWRAQNQSRQQNQGHVESAAPLATPQYFEDFIAAEIARDKERGVATSPIAPSTISDLSTVQKRWLRRHRKQWWLFLVTLQLAFGSTVAAIVISIQNAKGAGLMPGHLIWLLLSIALGIVSVAVLTVLYVRRRDRRRKEKAWAKLEVEKYRRDMQKSQKEADRASTIGKRLGREYRSASRAASVRTRSVYSERGSKMADPTEMGEVGGTFLDYQEIYRDVEVARDTVGTGPSTHAQPSRSRQHLQPPDDSGTVQEDNNGPSPPVPPKDIVSPRDTASSSDPTYGDTANNPPTTLDRFVRDEINPRAVQDDAQKEVDVIRAGHGEGGSVQSDENFREMHQLDSDAVSDDSYMAERRRGRSREQVEPWRRRQLSRQKLDDPQTRSKAPQGRNASNSRGRSEGKGALKRSRKKMKRQKSTNGRAKQHPGEETSRRREDVTLSSNDARPSSPQRRPIRSRSTPVRSSKGKEKVRDV